MGLMDQRFTDKPFLGVGQMHTWLQRSGHTKWVSTFWVAATTIALRYKAFYFM